MIMFPNCPLYPEDICRTTQHFYNKRTAIPFCDGVFRDSGGRTNLHTVFRDIDMMDGQDLLRFICQNGRPLANDVADYVIKKISV
jgi:hypothetical protein